MTKCCKGGILQASNGLYWLAMVRCGEQFSAVRPTHAPPRGRFHERGKPTRGGNPEEIALHTAVSLTT